MKGQGRRWAMGRVLCAAVLALWAGCGVAVSPGWAQDKDAKAAAPAKVQKNGREVLIPSHRARFEAAKGWKVQESQGIFFIQSKDQGLLLVMVLLETPQEIPKAMEELDKMVSVTDTRFGKARTTVSGAIPMQILPGAGKLQPSGREVELLSVTLNVVGKPIVAMAYVHKQVFDRHLPDVDAFLKSFALLMTPEEAEAARKALREREKGAPAAPK